MGILAFLTSSRLKAELTRQRDEIARMHQMLDMEVAQRQEAERLAEEQTKLSRDLEEQSQKLREDLQARGRLLEEERADLRAQIEEEREVLQQEAEKKIHETEIRIATLRQELDDKQRQRTEVTEQNARLAQTTSQFEQRLNEMAGSVEACEQRIRDLENEKRELQQDLDKIMGDLTRW